jgi:type III restriction enzyme
LPFSGERTGNEKVDKLTVVAHDNFDTVIAAAQDPNSILNKLKFIEIDEEQLKQRVEVVTVQNTINQNIQKEQDEVNKIVEPAQKQKQQNIVDAKKVLVNVIPFFNTNSQVKKVDDLMKPEVRAQVMEAVYKELNSGQGNLFAMNIVAEAEVMYERLVADFKKNIIEIPRMDLVQGLVTASFEDFDLNISDFTYEQLNEEIVRIGLKDRKMDIIEVKKGVYYGKPEKLLISELINFSEIDYDTNADLLHKLAKQAIAELLTNLKDGEDLNTLVFQWRGAIANKMYHQMMEHFKLHEPGYIKPNVRPFTKIEDWNFTTLKNEGRKDYRDDSFPAVQVPKYVFIGFEKSCHFEYKFDSRTEQTFSFILENDKDVLKWLRPAPNQFRIYWLHNSKIYEPDFVAETADCIYLVETKRADEIPSNEVQAKAQAALKYCNYATEYTAEHGGKPWKYVLIPHDQVSKTNSFKGVVSNNIFKTGQII